MTCKSQIFALISMTPLILVYLNFLDMIYIFNSICLIPFGFLMNKLTYGKINWNFTEGRLDNVYKILFDMNEIDILGFRRQRTIS